MGGLRLLYHPLSSYCWKVLIALYENGTSFTPQIIDLGNEASAVELRSLWPLQRFPVIEDRDREAIIPEASIIIEYLALHYPGNFLPIPVEADSALETRLMDRIFDNYVMTPVQTVVFNRIAPEDARSSHGVARAQALLATGYGLLETRLAGRNWAAGDMFTLADCAAAPSLYYADKILPFRNEYPILAQYLARLETRSSFARVLSEAAPYFHLFPAG